MFVSLHPLSRDGGAPQRVPREGRRREILETNGTREIACVGASGEARARDTDESKRLQSNSYNEEFDPGSG